MKNRGGGKGKVCQDRTGRLKINHRLLSHALLHLWEVNFGKNTPCLIQRQQSWNQKLQPQRGWCFGLSRGTAPARRLRAPCAKFPACSLELSLCLQGQNQAPTASPGSWRGISGVCESVWSIVLQTRTQSPRQWWRTWICLGWANTVFTGQEFIVMSAAPSCSGGWEWCVLSSSCLLWLQLSPKSVITAA